ncbi:MAG: zinc-ribbon domain-containing protein, partial [Deltaproteobacteria bacterium]|nr:zinc-ribbon domain-containing protein [Deltaproteobacteria bacterium]
MDITCDKCQSMFRIPDEKIPVGKTAIFQCTKCKNRISVSLNQKTDDIVKNIKKDSTDYHDTGSQTDDVFDNIFDFDAKEGKTALVCESDLSARQKLVNALEVMKYH